MNHSSSKFGKPFPWTSDPLDIDIILPACYEYSGAEIGDGLKQVSKGLEKSSTAVSNAMVNCAETLANADIKARRSIKYLNVYLTIYCHCCIYIKKSGLLYKLLQSSK
ncbi:hypothetical protein ACTFIT_008096 [Dictyostelium discoideum]